MSYCVNPSCPHPKNPNDVQVCQACGGKLRLNGRYQVLGLLGKGGFGATFASADVGLPGTPICVVKQLRPNTDDPNVFRMAKELFEREAQTLGKVGNHPQVPRLLDYFEEDQQFYLVQEYVKGHNLHQEVKKHGPFSEAGAKQFLEELLPILTYIHSQKVIHRDIKPANLIRRQTDSKLVLIDFGAVKNEVNSVLASNTSAQTALTAFAVGTAGFAPPEQMAMRPVYASDIYAVGITCLYLLTGKTPKEMDCNHQTGEIDWEKYVTVSESFATVIKNMLELSVRHRYKSAQQVLDAMQTLPYEEGMRQGLISAPVSGGHNAPPSTGFLSPAEPSTRLGRGAPSTSFNSGMQTGIKTRTHSTNLNPPAETTRLSPAPARKPSPNAASTPRPAVNGGMDFNVAMKGSPKRDRRSVDTVIQNQPVQWNSKSFLSAYEKGQRDFADQDLQGLTLLKGFLPAINCYQSNLTRANFQGSDLTRADFGKATLTQANLKDANLSDAYFGYANLEGADFRGANLQGANFKYANIRGANFCGVDLSSTQINPDQLSMAKTNWRTVMPNGKRGW
ncbi:MAG: protein kinase [Cyanobacteria bacterium RI_101]|nr:protein kinase [Cyanobacteria bacterium RI_101]